MSSTITASPVVNNLQGQIEVSPAEIKKAKPALPAWKNYQKVLFRIAFMLEFFRIYFTVKAHKRMY